MVSTNEGFNNNIPIYPMTSTPVKKPSAITSLCLFTSVLDVKKKTATCRVRSSKSRYKAVEYGTKPW